MEIERKWIVNSFPNSIYTPESAYIIDQSYLNTDPEVRIRKQELYSVSDQTDPTYYLAIKSNGDLIREEIEVKITKDEYYNIQKMIGEEPIKKLYKRYKFANFIIEISKVDDSWYYAEVEFNNEDEAKAFVFPFPDIVIQEVTNNPKFKMKEIWKHRDLMNIQYSGAYGNTINIIV